MANGTDFLLKVQTQLQGNAASELARVEQQLKSGVATYAQYERASQAAAKGLADVGNRATELRAKMAAQMAAGDEKGFWKSADALNKLAEKQSLLKTKASEAAAGMDRQKSKLSGLSGKFDELNKAQRAQIEGGVEVGKGLKKLGGPLGKLGDFVDDAHEGWAKLANELGTAGAVGAVAAVGIALVAVAVVAVGAAVIAGAVSFGRWALGMANARRESALTTEALSKTSAGFARTTDAIDETQRATGLATERLQAITGDLRAAGLSATDIPYALRAIATQEAALGGDTSGTAALVDKLKAGQVEARALATDMDQRLGGVVQRRMMSLDGLIAQLTRHLSDIFGSFNIEPLLEGGQRLVSLLDTSNGSGRTLKALFEVLSPSLEGVAPIAVQIERLIIGMEIAALRLAIGVKAIRKQFGGVDLGALDGLVDAADVGQVAFYALLVVVGLAIVAFGALGAVLTVVAVAGLALMAVTVVTLGLLLAPVIIAVGLFALGIYGIYSAAQALKSLDWAGIGKSIVDGLLGPILDPGATVAAFAQFGTNAIGALKAALGIASPSKVFEQLGGFSAQGFAVGLEDGTPQVESALSSMTSAPATAARGGEAPSVSVSMGDVIGVKDGEDLVERIADKVLELLEGVGRQGATT